MSSYKNSHDNFPLEISASKMLFSTGEMMWALYKSFVFLFGFYFVLCFCLEFWDK